MANTGYKGWTTLEEYYTDNNELTGNDKLNTLGMDGYREPVIDYGMCPIPIQNFTLSPSYGLFFNSVTGGGIPSFNYPVTASTAGHTDNLNAGAIGIELSGVMPSGSGLGVKVDIMVDGTIKDSVVYSNVGQQVFLNLATGVQSPSTIRISINTYMI